MTRQEWLSEYSKLVISITLEELLKGEDNEYYMKRYTELVHMFLNNNFEENENAV